MHNLSLIRKVARLQKLLCKFLVAILAGVFLHETVSGTFSMKQCQVPFPARGHFDPTWEEIAQLTLAVHQKNRCVFMKYVRANELVVSGLPSSFPSRLSLSSRKRGINT